MKQSLTSILVALLPFGVLAPACTSSGTSTASQQITCETDPSTGVVLSCQPGGGGGANTCHDIDEDGDGEPHDEAEDPTDDTPHASFDGGGGDDGEAHDADDDHDGVPDDDDCDHHPGEDEDHDDAADLPYDVRPALGATTSPVLDAFAAKGMQPASIVSVTGAAWRGAELAAGSSFVVTADDCAHAGNRDIGRDRVVVTWANADGSEHADHLDIRYCK
jgi:hypothetical protein